MKGPSFVLTLLNKIVSEAVTNKVQNIKILKTKLGAVFDVPEIQAKAIQEGYTLGRLRKSVTFSIESISELPEIIE